MLPQPPAGRRHPPPPLDKFLRPPPHRLAHQDRRIDCDALSPWHTPRLPEGWRGSTPPPTTIGIKISAREDLAFELLSVSAGCISSWKVLSPPGPRNAVAFRKADGWHEAHQISV